MALYGIYRDIVVGCSVDDDKDGKMGDVIGDTMNGLIQVYNELEKAETEHHISTEQAIDEIVGEICEHGQHDSRFKLGETIKYTPSDIGKILKEAADLE